MKFKTIYFDVIESVAKAKSNNSQREHIFMDTIKIEQILKQLRMFCDHISFSLFHDINDHPNVTEIFTMSKDLGFRFDVKITSLRFIDYIEENLDNNAIANVTLDVASLEKNNCLTNIENTKKLYESIIKLSSNHVHVIVDLPSKNPETYKKETLDFINTLGLDLNNRLWQKGFQVNINQYLMIRCCEQIEDTKNLPIKTIGRCYGAVTMLGVLGNGDVIPCNHENGKKIIMGNLFNDSLSDILSKEPYLSISDGFYKNELFHPVCQRCPRPRKHF